MSLIARAPGKVNLCLFLGGQRPDRRHELVTLLESVSLADELELAPGPQLGEDTVHCPGVEGLNLAATTLAELRARGWDVPPVRLDIRKRVPVAAGMGGGSADAAATLRLAAALAPLPPDIALIELAAELGADVPSQLKPGLTLATGAGESVTPIAPLAAHAFVVLGLPTSLSTKAVYDEADRLVLPRAAAALRERRERLTAALSPGAELPADLVVNDLQPAALSLLPAIEGSLLAMRAAGADHAFVCGSGPTVAGLFWEREEPAERRARAAAAGLAVRFTDVVTASPVDAAFGSPRHAP